MWQCSDAELETPGPGLLMALVALLPESLELQKHHHTCSEDLTAPS